MKFMIEYLSYILDRSIASTDSPCKLHLRESEYAWFKRNVWQRALLYSRGYYSTVTVSAYISGNSLEYVWIDLQDCVLEGAGRSVGSAGTGPAAIPDGNLIPTWISLLLRLYTWSKVATKDARCLIYAPIIIIFFYFSRLKQITFDSFCDYRARICINRFLNMLIQK